MFTGIIERTGRVVSLTRPAAAITQLIVDAGKDYDTKLGDSVAINGCCLTVVTNKMQMLAFDVSSETLAKTSLSLLGEGSEVNMERAMRVGDRLGGHIVTGHVDGTGKVAAVSRRADGWEVMVAVPKGLSRYVIPKGSICLDGVSLTVNSLEDRAMDSVVGLMLIPMTVDVTTFKHLVPGQLINVEVDTIGKFVERLTSRR